MDSVAIAHSGTGVVVQPNGARATESVDVLREPSNGAFRHAAFQGVPAIRCALGHAPSPSIAVVCPNDDCDRSLVTWPIWFGRTSNRQLFVNGLRLAAFAAALALAYVGLHWPVGLMTLILAFLFLSVLLREWPWAEQRTLLGGTLTVGMLYAFAGSSS